MLTVSSSIEPTELQTLLVEGSELVFGDTNCKIQVEDGRVIGDSPYGYVDYMGELGHVVPLVSWARAWLSFSPNYA